MSSSITHSINAQRAILHDLLKGKLSRHANDLMPLLGDRQELDASLQEIFRELDHCKYLYVLDANALQLSSNITRYGADEESIGRDRSQRPYMLEIMADGSLDFYLSEAYISRNKKRPSVTVVQSIRDEDGHRCGLLGVDFDLRELPHSEVLYEEPSLWRKYRKNKRNTPAYQGRKAVSEIHREHPSTRPSSIHRTDFFG